MKGRRSLLLQNGINMKLTARETVIFAMLGAVMYASKVVMEFAPNIHLLGALTIAYTVVYRKKALYPIYTYVILNDCTVPACSAGFATSSPACFWQPVIKNVMVNTIQRINNDVLFLYLFCIIQHSSISIFHSISYPYT